MINKRIVYALLLLPAFLLGWGEDVYMFRSEDGASPLSYDLTICDDTLMFAAYRYYQSSATYPHHLYIYVSRDTGRTWTFWRDLCGADTTFAYEESYLDFVTDSLVAFFPIKALKSAYIAKVAFNDSTQDVISNPSNFSDLDTILDFKFKNIYTSSISDYIFYTAALGKSGDTTIFEVQRSDDHGATWSTIIRRIISYSTSLKLRLLDFEASSIASDSVMFLYVESYHDTTSDDYAVYTEVWVDALSGTPTNITGLFPLKYTGSVIDAAASILGTSIVWAIADTGTLFFAWSTDTGNTVDTMSYPYNDEFSYISGLDIASWYFLWSSGFDLTFIGNSPYGQKVWVQKIYFDGDSISFSEPPGIVSDTTSYTYIFNFSPYYKPRIKYTWNLFIPGIMWHLDYSHLTGSPPCLFYDSTQFYFDYSTYTGIKENKNRKSILSVKINGNTLFASSTALKGIAKVKIVDITGRVVANKVATPHNNTVSTDITSLRRGIYFITIETNNIQLKGKFVKME